MCFGDFIEGYVGSTTLVIEFPLKCLKTKNEPTDSAFLLKQMWFEKAILKCCLILNIITIHKYINQNMKTIKCLG